jgi:hypothetical protein
MAIVILLGLQVSGLRMMDLPLPPDVLTAKAQEIIRTLGYAECPMGLRPTQCDEHHGIR